MAVVVEKTGGGEFPVDFRVDSILACTKLV